MTTAMTMPVIIEQRPPGPLVSDENGTSVPRKYSVLAASELSALTLLKAAGVYRGAVFRDSTGVTVNPPVICQRVSIVGKPAAVRGGIGQYICIAEYSSQQGTLRAVPGGPVVWSPRPSLSSGPVDLDGQFNPILTSSEEPLDPPLSCLRPNETIHGQFYVQGQSAAAVYMQLRNYNGCLNASTFLGASRGCILSHVFTPQPSDTGWVLVDVDFEYRKAKTIKGKQYEGWHDVFQDVGTRIIVKKTSTDPFTRYQNLTVPDQDGNPRAVEQPYALDGKGQKGDPAKPVFIDVNNYTYAEFNSVPGMRLS